jgi:hypothetical protein
MIRRPALLLPLAAIAALGVSCSRQKLLLIPVPNQRPIVELVGAPPDTSARVTYTMHFSWTGFDPDGEVDHYVYAVDPAATGDTTWARTSGNGGTFTFSAGRVDSARYGFVNTATELHTFVIKAVDREGLTSAPDWRSFNAYTLAPQVRILQPQPHNLLFPRVASSVVIRWTGTDPDGPPPKLPAKYKFKLYRVGDPAVDFSDLSKLNRLGPAFAGWDSLPGSATFTEYENLQVDSRFVFVITAIDEAGAWDPAFNQRTNVLVMSVTYASLVGPTITLFNEYFNYTYPSGGYSNDPSRYIRIEVPADELIHMNWSATANAGYAIRRHRWAVDITDLTDETPRSDQNSDLQHWSNWGFNVTRATFGPFSPSTGTSEMHRFYLEVEDNAGLRSLGVVEMAVVRPTLTSRLLIVDDRRGTPDRYASIGRLGPPPGSWPSEAELDTFYFARGGFPWKGYGPENGLPAQLLSPPGVFLGYDYDTLDTRNGISATVPLSVIGRYRYVVWYVDKASADMGNEPYDAIAPITSLRYMTSPDRFNSMGLFLTYGGKLMLFGGGVVSATMRGWADGDNTFEATGSAATLRAGLFPYDVLHMRADMRQVQATSVRLSPKRPARFAGLVDLLHRTSAGDPLPPLRGTVPIYVWVELVSKPLKIVEDVNPDPAVVDSASTLDTLFIAAGGAAGGQPCGFYYHGRDNPEVIYLGFDLWTWQRSRLIQTIDFFLGNIWGLPREPLSRDPQVVARRPVVGVANTRAR